MRKIGKIFLSWGKILLFCKKIDAFGAEYDILFVLKKLYVKKRRESMAKWVYLFTEGNANMRELLGGKGANLAEMTNLGLPVPQGFTITTEACTQYYEDGR